MREYQEAARRHRLRQPQRAKLVTRTAIVLLAVALARLAYQPGSSTSLPDWVLYSTIGAIVLAAVAIPWPFSESEEPGEERGEEWTSTLIGGGCIVIPTVIAMYCWSLEPFRSNQEFVRTSSTWAAFFWVAGMTTGVFYLWRLRPPSGARNMSTQTWVLVVVESLLVLAILDLALALRVWQLGSVPEGIWFDEADSANAAQRMLSLPFQPFGPGNFGHNPSLYFYIVDVTMKLAGQTVGGIRLASALLGTIAVAAVYLLGRRLGGASYGMCAAILLAFGKWAIDFSRFGMPNIAALALISVGFFFLALAMLRPRAIWFALSGLTLGLSMLTYTGGFLSAGIVSTAVVCLRLLTDRGFRHQAWPCALLLPVGLFVGAAPLIVALRLDPDYTLKRVREVSLFTEYSDLQDRTSYFFSNLRLHLFMFTVQGDSNGRHNLPSSPMLDTTTATLFLLGLGMCIRRIGYWFSQLLLLWLGASLLGGILSLSFEAPQGARTLGAIAPIALIAALPLTAFSRWLWAIVTRMPAVGGVSGVTVSGRRVALSLTVVGAIVLVPLGVAAHDNYNEYFNTHQADASSWAAMGGMQALIGRAALELQAQGYSVRIPPEFAGDIALLLAAHGESFTAYDPEIPVTPPVSAGGLALIIPSTSADVLSNVTRSYPGATVVALTPAKEPANVQAHAVLITQQDVEADIGATATFGSGSFAVTIEHATGAVPWPASVRLDAAVAISATLMLSEAQEAAPVSYRVSGIESGYLTIDGESWPISMSGTPRIVLGAGNHSFVAQGHGKAAEELRIEEQIVQGTWLPVPGQSLESPGLPTGGLLGIYYATGDLTGQPSFAKVDQFVNSYYQTAPGNLNFPFSVRWLGSLDVTSSGTYAFLLDSTGPSALFVDGRSILTSGAIGGVQVGTVFLTVGAHAMRVDYRATGSYLHCYLKWQPPGQAGIEPIPPSVTQPAHL